MKISKGICRIELKSGLVAFGKVIEVSEKNIRFQGYNPIAIERNIPIANIVSCENYSEEDIPPYE